MTPTDAMKVTAPIVEIDGSAVTGDWKLNLSSVRVESEFRVPSRCVLRFADEGYQLSGDGTVALGSAVTVKILNAGAIFKGEVTGLGIEQDHPGAVPQFVVTAHDKGHKLLRGTSVATYAGQPYSDIVSAIASDAGLTGSVDSTTGNLDYVLRVDSAIAMLNAIADRTGNDWWVDDSTLHFAAPAAGTTVSLNLGSDNPDLFTFEVRASGLHADSVAVRGWDRKQKQSITATADASGASMLSTASFFSDFTTPGSKLGGTKTLTTTALVPADSGGATSSGQAIRDQLVYGAMEARGTCRPNVDLKPGAKVTVTGPSHLAGDYHVTKVEHVYRRQGFETRFVAGSRRPTSLVDTLGAGAVTSSFRMPALVVGTVDANKPAEGEQNPPPTGWVRVKYAWLGDTTVSAWARVATVGGGNNRGIVFMPEVNDEVLIGFEHGDPARPVVLGGLYGSTDAAPAFDITDSGVITRKIVSRTGHSVEISDGDSDDKKHVLIQLSDSATKLRLGLDKSSLEIPSGKELTIKVGDNHIVFGTDNSIEIKAQSIKLTATQNIDITSSGGNVTAKSSGGNIDLEGLQATLKGTTSGTVDGGVSLTLKGATGVAIN